MARILLSVHNRANRHLLREWLSESHEVFAADCAQDIKDVELWIVDSVKIEVLQGAIDALKEEVAPLFLPVLLIVHREDVGLATHHLWRSVDEVITTPISRVELQARLQQLLNTRSMSKRLKALGVQQTNEKLQVAFLQTVELATRLSEARDPYTSGHERRVADIAVAIGREMGLSEQQLLGLRVEGLLHDVGKIAVPSEILSRTGKLSRIEYELIKTHAAAGYEVLIEVDFPWPVAQVALQHHERIDGSGYPRGLKGEEILLEARITAVADVIEAMSNHRPYRPAMGLQHGLREIEENRGLKYDSLVVDATLMIFRKRGYTVPA